MAAQEMTILGYHLRHNLWFDDEQKLVHMDEGFSLGIDIAMAARRRALPGAATPPVLLTHHEGTTLSRILQEIQVRPEPAVLDQGFQLLELDGPTRDDLNRLIDGQAQQAARDGKPHSLALMFADKSGLTVLISAENDLEASQRLAVLTTRRKYLQKADLWFGLCLAPDQARLRFGMRLAEPWHQDDQLDAAVAREEQVPPVSRNAAMRQVLRGGEGNQKIGRNDPCPCGSGRKWKKCCGP